MHLGRSRREIQIQPAERCWKSKLVSAKILACTRRSSGIFTVLSNNLQSSTSAVSQSCYLPQFYHIDVKYGKIPQQIILHPQTRQQMLLDTHGAVSCTVDARNCPKPLKKIILSIKPYFGHTYRAITSPHNYKSYKNTKIQVT